MAKEKQLTAPEIRRLIKAHNVLTKITIPKGSKKADLIQLVEDAGFKVDHVKKKIVKVKAGKQDIAVGKEIDLPPPPTKLTPEEKKAKKKESDAKKQGKETEAFLKRKAQLDALKKLKESKAKAKAPKKLIKFQKPKGEKGGPAPKPPVSKPSKPAPKVAGAGSGEKVSEKQKKFCMESTEWSKRYMEGVAKKWTKKYIKEIAQDLLDAETRFKVNLAFQDYDRNVERIKSICGMQEANIYTKAYGIYKTQNEKHGDKKYIHPKIRKEKIKN